MQSRDLELHLRREIGQSRMLLRICSFPELSYSQWT
jgi:hypothetical protein